MQRNFTNTKLKMSWVLQVKVLADAVANKDMSL